MRERGFSACEWDVLNLDPEDFLPIDKIVELIEDYKTAHDLQDAMVSEAMRKTARQKHPELRYTMTGQGGDEFCQDYNLHESGVELDEVRHTPHLYVEGRSHLQGMTNPMFSGGLGRRIVRDYAPAVQYGFVDFSPICSPGVARVLYGVPKAELIRNEEELYRFKLSITEMGLEEVTGISYQFPPKNRFQVGACDMRSFDQAFSSVTEERAREMFSTIMHRKKQGR